MPPEMQSVSGQGKSVESRRMQEVKLEMCSSETAYPLVERFFFSRKERQDDTSLGGADKPITARDYSGSSSDPTTNPKIYRKPRREGGTYSNDETHRHSCATKCFEPHTTPGHQKHDGEAWPPSSWIGATRLRSYPETLAKAAAICTDARPCSISPSQTHIAKSGGRCILALGRTGHRRCWTN
jgi:hypothetical protein